MDYLAGVLRFIFVDKVHQKESETHIQTLKHTHTHDIAIRAVFFHQYLFTFSYKFHCLSFNNMIPMIEIHEINMLLESVKV